MIFLQAIFLIILIVSAASLIKNKVAVSVFLIFSSIFLTVQASSVFLTNSIADYKFYEHFHLEIVTSVWAAFKLELFFAICFSVLSYLFLIWTARVLRNFSFPNYLVIGIAVISFLGLLIPGGIFSNIYNTFQLRNSKSRQINEILSQLPPGAEKLIKSRHEIESQAGDNILFISLESFELSILNSRPDLTPGLNKLKEKFNLYPITPTEGGGWTSASAYMTMTGLPAYFGKQGNEIFYGTNDIGLNNLGDVLNEAGYTLDYFIAKKEFSGMDNILSSMNFNVLSEKDFDTKYDLINWGIHDADLLTEVENKYKAKTTQPFAIFVSTISTHFPDGIVDNRYQNLFQEEDTDLEKAIRTTDHLISKLIKALENFDGLKNTTVIIAPDHTFMGKMNNVVDDSAKMLYLFTNKTFSEKEIPKTQSEMPRSIINLAGIKSNAIFLSDLIEEPNSFIENNKILLRDLNIAALEKASIDSGIQLSLNNNQLVFENIKNQSIYTGNIEYLKKGATFFFDSTGELSKYSRTSTLSKKDSMYSYQLKIKELDTLLYAEFTNNITNTKISKFGNPISLTHEELLDQDNLGSDKTFREPVVLTIKSSGHATKKLSYTNFQISDAVESQRLKRGISCISVNNGELYINHYDTYANPNLMKSFIKSVDSLKKRNEPFAIAAHDTAGKTFSDFSEQLVSLGLNKLSNYAHRMAYVSMYDRSTFTESMNDSLIEKSFPFLASISKSNASEKELSDLSAYYSNDRKRFIAHAGGRIDGKNYTNSLEALNLNYDKGFRLFELDLIETGDGHIVAAHDWKYWQSATKYEGELPVNKRTFLKYMLFENYTPLDMRRINQWFEDHPDAILVTDKINDPLKLKNAFNFPERLRMELFSKASIEKAKDLGIEPVISESVLQSLGGNALEFMVENEVKYIAMSRKNIDKRIDLIKSARLLDIKTYVYHVNFEKSKDEKFVVANELGEVFGLYADTWEFANE